MSIDTAPCEESAWKRRPLAEMSDATLVDFFQNPDRPVFYADIASAVPGYGSYQSIKGAVDDGHLREPVRLPNGRLVWRAGDVLHDLGLEQLRPDTHQDAPYAASPEPKPDDHGDDRRNRPKGPIPPNGDTGKSRNQPAGGRRAKSSNGGGQDE